MTEVFIPQAEGTEMTGITEDETGGENVAEKERESSITPLARRECSRLFNEAWEALEAAHKAGTLPVGVGGGSQIAHVTGSPNMTGDDFYPKEIYRFDDEDEE
jgi:hypothetical protein